MTFLRKLPLALAIVAAPLSANATTIAYEVAADTQGNQSYTEILGMDFVVNSAINVLSLGAFDDYRNGVYGISANTVLTTEIWSRTGDAAVTKLASETFSAGDEGTLVGSSRFKSLSQALSLGTGEYTVVSYGYNRDDNNGNKGSWPLAPWSTNDAGGLISFVGGGRYGGTGGTGIGNINDGGPVDRYAAGTFTFESAIGAVPVPASLPLLAAGLGLFGLVRRRKG